MYIKDVFSEVPEGASEYLEYYFHDMVGLNKEKQVNFDILGDRALSIMKDETKRMLEGTGRLREKPWSNFTFHFISKEKYKEIFGLNKQRRNIFEEEIKNDFSLTEWDESYRGKNPEGLNYNSYNNYKLSRYLFDNLKLNEPFLFVRSYVYITIVIYDDTKEISEQNFLTYYFNTNYKFTSTNGRRNFIHNVNYSYLVEDVTFEYETIMNNNRDVLDCAKAYNGDLDFIDQTKYHYDNIVSDIDEGDEFVLIEGAARTGKTIIAMSLLRKYPEANMLVMNYYFYCSLKEAFLTLDYVFPKTRIFHQNANAVGHYNNGKGIDFSFCIIDECQRLGERFGIVNSILDTYNHKHTILLGDDFQRIKKQSDDGIEYCVNKILSEDKRIKKYKFNNSIGVPAEVVKNVKYLLGSQEVRKPYYIGEYLIKVYNKKEEFLERYKSDKTKRKHLSTIFEPSSNYSDIGRFMSFPKRLINTDYPYFLNKEIIDDFYLSPYEMISREVESMYVYVRENVTISEIKSFALTQLYILMTRATMKLNLFFENEETNNYFKKKVDEIYKLSTEEDFDFDNVSEKEQFFIKEKSVELVHKTFDIISPKEELKKRFVTRLVHFTDERNIEGIMLNGLQPRSYLQGNNFIYNDEHRWDGHPDSICLSVENPNGYLLNAFKRKYPGRNYKLITIDPSILYSSFIKKENEVKLTKRYYCNYNAAARDTKKSRTDINVMYSEKFQRYNLYLTRENLKDSIPTVDQAEILFFGKIPAEFIVSIEDI